MTEKPPTLSVKQIMGVMNKLPLPDREFWIPNNYLESIAQAQRDDTWKKAQAIYFPIMNESIAQARQETAKELMKTIETMYPELRQVYWQGKGWQSLKEKYEHL